LLTYRKTKDFGLNSPPKHAIVLCCYLA